MILSAIQETVRPRSEGGSSLTNSVGAIRQMLAMLCLATILVGCGPTEVQPFVGFEESNEGQNQTCTTNRDENITETKDGDCVEV